MTPSITQDAGIFLPRATIKTLTQALLGAFVAITIMASYLGMFYAYAMTRFLLLVPLAILLGCAIGAVGGRLSGGTVGDVGNRFADALFWSSIGVVYGFLVVLHTVLYHWTAILVWPIVGGIAAAVAAVCGEARFARRMLFGSVTALGLVSVYTFSLFGFRGELLPELACAALGGALMGAGVDLVERFEKSTSVPRYLLAIGLIGMATAGHWWALKHIAWL